MKDFQKSDELRLKIAALGYEVKDTSEGQEVKKKKSL
jgi:cysteinyl-tRNA synthetase